MMLPKGWVETTIGDVTTTKLGKMLDANKNMGESVEYLRNVNVRWGTFDLSDLLEMRVTAEEREELAVRDGDLFVCEGGEPGRCAVWCGGKRDLVFQKAIHRIRPLDAVNANYVAAFFTHLAVVDGLSHLFTGTTIKHLPQGALQRVALPLPPAAEQLRIVAKLDSLSAKISFARAELDRVPSLAKQLRVKTLIDAFGGRTQSSRLQRSQWESYSAAEVCAKVQSGGTPKEGFVGTGVPFLKVYNIVAQQVAFDHKPQYVASSVHEKELRKSITFPGDVLMNIVGPPLGKVAIVPDALIECNINQAIALFRPSGRIVTKWLYYFLRSGQSVTSVVNDTRGIAGQVNISLSQCRAFQIPVPPIDEQEQIIGDIEAAFARANRLEAEAARARVLLDRLEAAILAKAFRGELVPQDPNDEPASVLLDRIRAERAAAPKPKRGRARKAVG